MKFKVGDRIKGKNNSYGITDERMLEGEVIELNDSNNMKVKVIRHKDNYYQGNTHWVENSDDKFALISAMKITKQKLLDMPIGTKIITDAKENNEYVYDGDSFIDENGCIDDYDINEDLTLDTYDEETYGTRIIKIEEPEYTTIYDYSAEVKEMTVAEIEKALGHAVKIIKEEY